ncbi:MAG: ATP-binding cassette domain-containing protein [Lachnospiraceae bacterium]|nr:ATP-binding cassette domain-containing protein [Lachnospiraceae bacterium]
MLVGKRFCIHYPEKGSYKMGPLDFEVEEGDFCLVLGKNGSGKTTLLRAVYGLLKTSGTLKFGDIDLMSSPPEQRHRFLAWIGDEQWCEPTSSVNENMAYLLPLYPDFDRELFEQMMEEFAFDSVERGKPYGLLSVAQKVLLQTAFAFSKKSKLILVDEPMVAMNLKDRERWVQRLHDQAEASGITVMMATHVLDALRSITDRVILMEDGRIAACERADNPNRSVAMQRARLVFRTMTPREEETYWAGKDGPGL